MEEKCCRLIFHSLEATVIAYLMMMSLLIDWLIGFKVLLEKINRKREKCVEEGIKVFLPL